eukprot:Pompholyxophrys_punicea_v1_NODE_1061_length_999_cov_5.770127.p1 type:complete len:121 gc:universal NODE_1061_length_999_cov_5.770127:963-601(-)
MNSVRLSSPQREARVSSSSHTPFSTLSPDSKSIRFTNVAKVVKKLRRAQIGLEKKVILLNDRLHEKINDELDSLEKDAVPKEIFQKVFDEDKSGSLKRILGKPQVICIRPGSRFLKRNAR